MRIAAWIGGFLWCFLMIAPTLTVCAQSEEIKTQTDQLVREVLEETGLTFEEIEESLGKTSLGEELSFQTILKQIWSGNTDEIYEEIGHMVKTSLFGEISKNKKNFTQIFLLAVCSALFANLASGFLSSALRDAGFYISYLAMTGLILQSFFLMADIVEESLSQVFSFMNAFLPAFAVSITIVSGSASSAGIYEMTLFLVQMCQWALKNVVFPLIEAYMAAEIMNGLSGKDKFSYLSHLLKKGTEKLLKWTTGVILGLQLIQNMILPAVDSLKSTIWQRGFAAIPGAGAVLSALTGTFLGASVLIKNSIGVGCLLILVLLCTVPLLKLMLFSLSFFLCSAFLQPVCEKRLMGLLFAAGESSKLFLQTLMTCFALFFITVALAAISTNMRYYGG